MHRKFEITKIDKIYASGKNPVAKYYIMYYIVVYIL